ncbi:MAG: O-antigen/teichoic acid export membrane protein [Lentimonas sp.]|jgi:O-antigen/teichoic acid export membrane protein
MLKLPQIFHNRDKFYGLADSAVLSLFRFGSGLAIARLGGSELFAAYILLITTSVIFQLLPSTCFIIPLLNRGTGAAPAQYGELCLWAQRGVERAALVFFLLGFTLLISVPNCPISLTMGLGFLCAASTQLLQQSIRSRLQMEFKQAHVLFADIIACSIHLLVSGYLWLQGVSLLSAFWWGATAAAITGSLLMKFQAKKLVHGADEQSEQLIRTARQQGRAMLRGSLANSACSRLQPYLLGAIANAEMLAFYGVLWTLIGPVRLLSMALTNLLRPRLALFHNQERPVEFARMYRNALSILSATGILASAAAIWLGHPSIELLFGTELAPASQWLSLALLYATLDAITTCQMIAVQIKREDGAALTARLRIHSAIISLVLVVPATVFCGLTGTIGSLLIAEIYYAIACQCKVAHARP